jgi:hypothetical protein
MALGLSSTLYLCVAVSVPSKYGGNSQPHIFSKVIDRRWTDESYQSNKVWRPCYQLDLVFRYSGLHEKKMISYDFKFYVGSTRHITKSFHSAALSTATQPW